MMNRFKAVLALTIFWTSTALAQVSISSTVYFPTGANVQRVYSSKGYLAYKNLSGQIASVVTRDANLDSLQEQNWSVTIDRQITGTPSYSYEVTVEGIPADPAQRVVYKDTVNIGGFGPRLAFPDRMTRTTVGGDPLPFNQDSIFSIWLRNAALPNGSKIDILFTRSVPVAGSATGAILANTAIDSFTVSEADTMFVAATAPIFTRAAYGNYQFKSVHFKVSLVHAADLGTIGLYAQIKPFGINSWGGSGLGSADSLYIIADSLHLKGSSWWSTISLSTLPACDSIRLLIAPVTNTDSVSIDTTRFTGRN